MPADVVRALVRDAPESLLVPSGRHRRLEYLEDGTVSAEVKLQEVFGLAETPRIGPRREPVLKRMVLLLLFEKSPASGEFQMSRTRSSKQPDMRRAIDRVETRSLLIVIPLLRA